MFDFYKARIENPFSILGHYISEDLTHFCNLFFLCLVVGINDVFLQSEIVIQVNIHIWIIWNVTMGLNVKLVVCQAGFGNDLTVLQK